jgi:hypothetical protein
LSGAYGKIDLQIEDENGGVWSYMADLTSELSGDATASGRALPSRANSRFGRVTAKRFTVVNQMHLIEVVEIVCNLQPRSIGPHHFSVKCCLKAGKPGVDLRWQTYLRGEPSFKLSLRQVVLLARQL